MPIKIPDRLPAVDVLHRENIFVMPQGRAVSQDIRPLQILLVNLMPKKIQTEVQFSRLLGNTSLQIELELIAPRTHTSTNTPPEHLHAFYKTFDDVRDRNFDGCIINDHLIDMVGGHKVCESYFTAYLKGAVDAVMNTRKEASVFIVLTEK